MTKKQTNCCLSKKHKTDALYSVFARMHQLLKPNVFGGGYNQLTFEANLDGCGSSIFFTNLATLLNHSCSPNIEGNKKHQKMTSTSYIALHHIAKGESLRISYLLHATKKELNARYDFDCDCFVCNKQ